MTKPSTEALALWTALLTAHRRLTTELDTELRAGVDMSLDEYDVLYQVRLAHGPVRMTDLAARVLISRPSTTRVTDRLVTRRWLKRSADPDDRRVVRVALTATGRAAQTQAARRHLDGIARLVEAPLAGCDVDAAVAVLRALASGGG